jgi:Dna[CI] antecedent, DciA
VKRPDDLRDVRGPLGRVMRRLGIPRPETLARLEAGWDDALGPAAAHARLVRLGDGEAVVEVDHPVWATRVQMAKGSLEELAGEPLRLEVSVRRGPGR